MAENPVRSQAKSNASEDEPQAVSSDRAAYNVVTDMVIGVNYRWSDNKFQAIFVLVSVVLAALVGATLTALYPQENLPWYGGALVGAFAGLVFGVFTSGLILMFYRAARHIRGEHD